LGCQPFTARKSRPRYRGGARFPVEEFGATRRGQSVARSIAQTWPARIGGPAGTTWFPAPAWPAADSK
jgi:hypothetical protein